MRKVFALLLVLLGLKLMVWSYQMMYDQTVRVQELVRMHKELR